MRRHFPVFIAGTIVAAQLAGFGPIAYARGKTS